MLANFGAATGTGSAQTFIAGTGTGGTGAVAGAAYGGNVTLLADDGTSVDLGAAQVTALGSGGSIVMGVGDCACHGTFLADSLNLEFRRRFLIGNVTVSGDADLTAAGIANFYGTLAAPTITTTSSGIYIATGASLGAPGITQLLTVNAMSDGSAIIFGDQSGTDGSSDFLNSDGDLYSDAVVFNALNWATGPAPTSSSTTSTSKAAGSRAAMSAT